MTGKRSPQAPDWWRASDGFWYPPETHEDNRPTRGEKRRATAAPIPEPEAMTATDLAEELSTFDPASRPRLERPAAAPVPRAPAPPPPAPRPRPRPSSVGPPPPQLPKRKNLFIPIVTAIAIMVIAFAVAILAAA